MHIHNFSVIQTSIINSNLLNVVTFATNYFLQTFNDANQSFNPQANAGLNLGITNPIVAAGAPSILITGFDQTGATQPSGRTDVTGHVTDNFHWTHGRHQMKFGGEFRHSNVNQLYFSSARGTFTFDGSRGPWGGAGTNLSAISDFLLGAPSNSSGARLLQGNAQRVWTLTTVDGWAADTFQATKNLTLTYGVRYTVPGVIQAAANDIYQFVPGTTPGFQKGFYPEYYSGIAPRVGFTYSPFENNTTVIRGSYGIFYDFPAMSSWVTGTTTNGGANYSQNNPAGPDAAAIFVQSNVNWTGQRQSLLVRMRRPRRLEPLASTRTSRCLAQRSSVRMWNSSSPGPLSSPPVMWAPSGSTSRCSTTSTSLLPAEPLSRTLVPTCRHPFPTRTPPLPASLFSASTNSTSQQLRIITRSKPL